jgi:hypothetical protein
MHLTEEPHDLLFRPIYPQRLKWAIVQLLEVDLCYRRISAWRERVDERLKRLLSNDDLINYEFHEYVKTDSLGRDDYRGRYSLVP